MQLYTPIEIAQLEQDLPHFIEILQYLRNFIAKPHPDVGRPGAVCPFVPKGLKLNHMRLKVVRSKNLEQQQIADIVLPHLNTFLELEPREREGSFFNKAILFIFPDISDDDAPRIINSVQQQLKPFFVDAGLMLGEFHNRTESPGLHNPNFRPLRSPIPMLVIRPMTEVDLIFLLPDDPRLRVRYLESYLRHFENKIKDEKRLKKAYQELELAKQQVIQENSVDLVQFSV
jgi:hypothetical protein